MHLKHVTPEVKDTATPAKSVPSFVREFEIVKRRRRSRDAGQPASPAVLTVVRGVSIHDDDQTPNSTSPTVNIKVSSGVAEETPNPATPTVTTEAPSPDVNPPIPTVTTESPSPDANPTILAVNGDVHNRNADQPPSAAKEVPEFATRADSVPQFMKEFVNAKHRRRSRDAGQPASPAVLTNVRGVSSHDDDETLNSTSPTVSIEVPSGVAEETPNPATPTVTTEAPSPDMNPAILAVNGDVYNRNADQPPLAAREVPEFVRLAEEIQRRRKQSFRDA